MPNRSGELEHNPTEEIREERRDVQVEITCEEALDVKKKNLTARVLETLALEAPFASEIPGFEYYD